MRKHAAKRIVKRITEDPSASLRYSTPQLRKAYRIAGVGDVPEEVWAARETAVRERKLQAQYAAASIGMSRAIREHEDERILDDALEAIGKKAEEEHAAIMDEMGKGLPKGAISEIHGAETRGPSEEDVDIPAEVESTKKIIAEGLGVPEELLDGKHATTPITAKATGYEATTVPDLKALCKKRGITGYSKMKKAELIEALTAE